MFEAKKKRILTCNVHVQNLILLFAFARRRNVIIQLCRCNEKFIWRQVYIQIIIFQQYHFEWFNSAYSFYMNFFTTWNVATVMVFRWVDDDNHSRASLCSSSAVVCYRELGNMPILIVNHYHSFFMYACDPIIVFIKVILNNIKCNLEKLCKWLEGSTRQGYQRWEYKNSTCVF